MDNVIYPDNNFIASLSLADSGEWERENEMETGLCLCKIVKICVHIPRD